MKNSLTISILLFLLTLSIALNLFQWQNKAVSCSNIDRSWKAELLYMLGHKHLDSNNDGIPCDYLDDK